LFVFTISLDFVTVNGYIKTVTSKELKRWLEKQGATFTPGKGSHLHVELNGRFSVLPLHGKDLGPLANAIKKQLGLK
jgi:mRNA interferase HicA